MIKLRSKRFSRSSSKLGGGGGSAANSAGGASENAAEGVITIRVSTVSKWHDISIQATSTFGELKMLLSLLTNLEPQEQRLLFKGKEREDHEHLHMVGVREKDKVLMLEDPAIKERKLLGLTRTQIIGSPYRTISAN
ncbi:hypothetical protein Pfo_030258 [Paulownia fortunei]|nr:hypothetical protein Pfo_030258 [Paulownia fortunei]